MNVSFHVCSIAFSICIYLCMDEAEDDDDEVVDGDMDKDDNGIL